MADGAGTPGAGLTQARPTVAIWPRNLSLRTKLTASVALSVALVITVVLLAAMQLAGQLVENDLRETARVTAVAVADEMELHPESDGTGIASVLHDFSAAAPSLRSISVF